MISRVDEPRQLYGLGSFVKKITKPIKKIAKSPVGKAALLAGGAYMAPKFFGTTWGGTGGWGSKLGGLFKEKALLGNLFHTGEGAKRKLSLGKMGLGALLAAGTALPFMGDEEEEIIETPWEETSGSISNIRDMARRQDPSLAFLPSSIYAQPGYYLADGGRAGLLNGGGAGQAQAEQMLKMEYQKYRNQGGTMSYQQFKMQVLKQAQQRGPMAPAQPQMMSKGGRSGYRLGELVEDEESVVMTPKGDEVFTDQMEEIEGDTAGPDWFIKRVEHLMFLGYGYDEASDIAADSEAYFEIVGDLSKLEGPVLPPDTTQPVNPFGPKPTGPVLPDREMVAYGGRVGLLGGGSVPGTRVSGYTTPAGYNKFDYPTGGVRVAAAQGGIMPLLDLKGKEKDYRKDGGFVGIGRKEKADDVPARLSKNEFVFTADAVRNAGGGDIDAGAEVMHNMMDHLEQGGQISEESQGIGAQGMYDNMKKLETRIA